MIRFFVVIMISRWVILLFVIVFFLCAYNIISYVLSIYQNTLILFKLFLRCMPIVCITFKFDSFFICVLIFGSIVYLRFRIIEDATAGSFYLLNILKFCFGQNYLLIAHNTKVKLFIFYLILE